MCRRAHMNNHEQPHGHERDPGAVFQTPGVSWLIIVHNHLSFSYRTTGITVSSICSYPYSVIRRTSLPDRCSCLSHSRSLCSSLPIHRCGSLRCVFLVPCILVFSALRRPCRSSDIHRTDSLFCYSCWCCSIASVLLSASSRFSEDWMRTINRTHPHV